MTRNTELVRVKPHLKLRPWPEHGVAYLSHGWVVTDGVHGDWNAKAHGWATRWNYTHRREPGLGGRAHDRFG